MIPHPAQSIHYLSQISHYSTFKGKSVGQPSTMLLQAFKQGTSIEIPYLENKFSMLSFAQTEIMPSYHINSLSILLHWVRKFHSDIICYS